MTSAELLSLAPGFHRRASTARNPTEKQQPPRRHKGHEGSRRNTGSIPLCNLVFFVSLWLLFRCSVLKFFAGEQDSVPSAVQGPLGQFVRISVSAGIRHTVYLAAPLKLLQSCPFRTPQLLCYRLLFDRFLLSFPLLFPIPFSHLPFDLRIDFCVLERSFRDGSMISMRC